MFGFLKDKLKKAISKFTKDVEEEVEETVKEKPKEEKKPSKETEKKKDEKAIAKEKIREEKPIKAKEEKKPEEHHKLEEKKTIKIEPERDYEKEIPVSKTQLEKPEKAKKPASVQKEKAHEEVPKGFLGRLKEAITKPKEEVKKEEPKELPKKPEEKIPEQITAVEKKEKQVSVEEKPKGFFEKLTEVVTKKTLSEEKFDDLFFELEVAMLENNVAVEVIEKIKNDLKSTLLSEKVSRVKTEVIVAEALKKSIEELFDIEKISLKDRIKKKKPYVICFVGVNGSGKTTNLAKVANYLKKSGFSVVIAACDTFRAAAIQQIEDHANRLDIKLVKHDYGADAAAVAYDAIEHAKAKGKDVVLIDTAGRSHANVNLMEELEKVVRVSKPDLNIFVGDSLTGNDAVEQAKSFNEKIGIDGIILSKVDVDEKGGAAISVSYVTKKPIIFIGTGQTYDDLEEFSEDKVIAALGV